MRLALAALALVLVAGPVQAQETPPPPPPPPAADPTEWRAVQPENLLIIETARGTIYVEMVPAAAPNHVERIRRLAALGFYDGLRFHRVIDWFMAQTGDPLGTGEGQSPYEDLAGEFTFRRGPELAYRSVASPAGAVIGFVQSLPIQTQPDELMARTGDGRVHAWGLYCQGVAGMARGDDPDSANSQFFLMRQPYPALDKRYTVWGRVVAGLDVVRAIRHADTPDGAVTSDADVMTRVRVASDLPLSEQPLVQVLDTASARFATLLEETRAARGADFSICDIDLPSQVTVPG